jgi:hypothetical protein
MVDLMTEIFASGIIFELLPDRLTLQHRIQRTYYTAIKNDNDCCTCYWIIYYLNICGSDERFMLHFVVFYVVIGVRKVFHCSKISVGILPSSPLCIQCFLSSEDFPCTHCLLICSLHFNLLKFHKVTKYALYVDSIFMYQKCSVTVCGLLII